ncbi:MAG: PQQ-binding-like beta-propeller repeat protein [Chloroflexota bacterium]|nr:PQQ-binding-like beta-propeller repeat protein [Chloroflexota bacterium]
MLWHYQTANRYSVFSTAPTVVGNRVYISTGNALYALDATTGKARWQQHWGAYNNSSNAVPVVVGNVVYIVAIDGSLHALDTSTGKELWAKAVDLATYIVPGQSATKGLLYLLQGFTLHTIDARTGAELWQTSLLTTGESSSSFQIMDAIVAQNAVYTSFSYYNGGGVFSAVDAKSGKQLWSTQLEKGYQFFHLLANNALVYMVATPLAAGKSFYEAAYATKTGSQLWTVSTDSEILDEPVLDNGLLYLNMQNGYTYAVNAQSGKKVWTYHANGDVNLSTVNNGTFYVEVGDAHIQENKQRMADGQLAFTPHYIVALNKNGGEVRRYNVPQGLYPGLLVVGNSTIYLVGETTLNFEEFHVFSALKGSNGAQLWQQKIKNLPPSGANTVVIP